MKDELRKAIQAALESIGISSAAESISLERPAEFANGDYSTGVALQHAKQAGKAPRALAEAVVAALGTIEGVAKIEVAGPGFINFYLAPHTFAATLEKARSTDMWGANEDEKGKKIMVEYTDPNPFKEFHIGHLMSNAIGESISRLLQFSGAEVRRANYQGDVGPHVAKAIWGIRKLGLDPSDASQLGKAYTAGATAYENDAGAKQEIDAINAKVYDRSDTEIDAIYDVGRETSLKHFEDIYKILGTKFDYYFFESDTAPRGLALVKSHPEVFKQSDGAIVYEGEKVGLHTRVFVTSKGLPTYEAKDLGLAELKAETWNFDRSITITAHEQSGYFKVVLAAMEEIMPKAAEKIEHVSHGMMRFAEGKMSSRTGNVITGESLVNNLILKAEQIAENSVNKQSVHDIKVKLHHAQDKTKVTGIMFIMRDAISRAINKRASKANSKEKSLLPVASQVAVAAVKFVVLRQGSGRDIIFDIDKSLSIEGDSGPYLQYAYARTCAVVTKAKAKGVTAAVDTAAEPNELARLLQHFPDVVEYAAHELEPHLLTNYLLELASRFNSWYAQEQILDGTPKAAHKVAVVEAVQRTLKNGLWVLGIPAPEKM